MKSPRCSTKHNCWSGCAPSLTLWHDTNANRLLLVSPTSGAVIVRPTRLPAPASSTKRYQYMWLGFSPPTKTRVVQSATSDTPVWEVATTCLNAASSETSTHNVALCRPSSYGRRVQRITLVESGSPDATPSG